MYIDLTCQAVPLIRRLVSGLSSQRPNFGPEPTHVRDLLDRVVVGQVALKPVSRILWTIDIEHSWQDEQLCIGCWILRCKLWRWGGSWCGCCCGSSLHVEVGCVTDSLEILLKVGDCKDHRNFVLHLNIVLVSFEMSTNCYEQWMDSGGQPKGLCCSVGVWRWYTTSELINFMGFFHHMCWHLTHCVPGTGSVPENWDRASLRNVVYYISVYTRKKVLHSWWVQNRSVVSYWRPDVDKLWRLLYSGMLIPCSLAFECGRFGGTYYPHVHLTFWSRNFTFKFYHTL